MLNIHFRIWWNDTIGQAFELEEGLKVLQGEWVTLVKKCDLIIVLIQEQKMGDVSLRRNDAKYYSTN